MPWLETCPMEQRCAFVLEASRPGANISELCRHYGIQRSTGYKWLARFQTAGSLRGLEERSRRPRHSPARSSPELVREIVRLRRRFSWGARKIQHVLGERGIRVSRSTVDRTLAREGLIADKHRRPQATKRFERSRSNDLWQVDFKGQYPLESHLECHPLSMLDDHSRYAIGLFGLTDQCTKPVWKSFVSAFRRSGLPKQILFDRGSPWWSTSNSQGLTRLGVQLIKQGIDLIFGAPGHPQTRGKVERFHGSLNRWIRERDAFGSLPQIRRYLSIFRQDYNELRPHEALEMRTPASRWEPSPREYQPHPVEWEYPEGAPVRLVSPAGAISYRDRTYFVSEALVGEQVSCTELDGLLVVVFRHMFVREVDLRTGRTRSIIRPAEQKVSAMS